MTYATYLGGAWDRIRDLGGKEKAREGQSHFARALRAKDEIIDWTLEDWREHSRAAGPGSSESGRFVSLILKTQKALDSLAGSPDDEAKGDAVISLLKELRDEARRLGIPGLAGKK